MNKKSIRFAKKDPKMFFYTMRTRVNAYFEENNITKTGNFNMYFKTFVMFCIYFVPFILILSTPMSIGANFALYFVMGLGLSGIGLSIMHDANHGAYSNNKTTNKLLGLSLNLVGGSSFTWDIQHNILHHTYTNIYEMDEDIHDKPFLRLSPHGKYKKHHKYQHWYALFLYSLATITWIGMKDFRQLKIYNKNGMTQKSGRNPKKEIIYMAITKLSYIGYILVLPILLGIPWYVTILGFVIMHLVAGVLITTIFQLAHVVEGTDHHAPPPSGTMENTWAIHQLHTTANFAKNNPFISWFVGGLNYQVEHHLFPHICHVHYKHISKIVKKTALEFDLPYHENKWFTTAVISHLKVLKSFGQAPTAVIKETIEQPPKKVKKAMAQ